MSYKKKSNTTFLNQQIFVNLTTSLLVRAVKTVVVAVTYQVPGHTHRLAVRPTGSAHKLARALVRLLKRHVSMSWVHKGKGTELIGITHVGSILIN